jgi:uncharacterized protein
MKKDIINILCCPVCKGPLTLSVDEEQDNEVITGTLTCASCHNSYPIRDGIADLLIKTDEETS